MIQKDEEWANVDHLGEKGWEFIAFVPNPEVYIKDSFSESMSELVRLAVFKRRMEDGETMQFGIDRAN
jgi:hypothetical protein